MTRPRPTRPVRTTLIALILALVLIGAAILLWPNTIGEHDVPETTTSETAVGSATPDSTSPATDTPSTEVESPAVFERVPALIVSARTEGGTTILSVDYIQFLTGDEAAAAAAERGDESPPPNDYYIVNDSTRLREFTAQEDIAVVTVVQDDGTADPDGHTLPLDDWVERLSGPAGDAFKASFYWLTISGDTITTIEQQYLP